MEILWKSIVSKEFQENRLKSCGNCVFLQNFCSKKLGEITAFFAVAVLKIFQIFFFEFIFFALRFSAKLLSQATSKWLVILTISFYLHLQTERFLAMLTGEEFQVSV